MAEWSRPCASPPVSDSGPLKWPLMTAEAEARLNFSPPLNAWHQHCNAQGAEPARLVALTDAPQMINRFRNADFIFANAFSFLDRFGGEEGYYSGKGRRVPSHRTWESNFVPDVRNFRLGDRSLRGQGATGIRLHLAANTMSAHIDQYPNGPCCSDWEKRGNPVKMVF